MTNDKVWQMRVAPPDSFAEEFPEYTPLERQLLWNRELRDEESVERFFNLDYHESLHDPWLFRSMRRVVDRIKKAIEDKEKILVLGDYDADGVCASSVLTEALRYCGAEPGIYIPDRSKEGHGLSDEAVRYAVENAIRLVITVDCGITNHEHIKQASEKGIDIIVTDHHEVPEELLPAYAVLDPKDPDSGYPFRGLSGTGVAFKLAQALIEECVEESDRERYEKWLLDRVAIATVADMMPLLDENRALVRYGLVVLSQTKLPGLKALLEYARVEPSFDATTMQTNITAETIGFRIAPRLNAASRMDHANSAFQLLMADNEADGRELAETLDNHNRDRQRETERMMRMTEAMDFGDGPIIVLASEDFPIGLAGLVAGRLTNKTGKPTIIIEEREDESVGSARSIQGLNLVELFEKSDDLFEDYGGHAMAAGFRIKTKNIALLREQLTVFASEMLKNVDTRPHLSIESEMAAAQVSFETIETLRRFEPFGQGNPAPLFLFKNWKIADLRLVGAKGGHLKLWLTKEAEDGSIKGIDAIAFGWGSDDALFIGTMIDCVGQLQANEWNGAVDLQILITDVRPEGVWPIEQVAEQKLMAPHAKV